MAELCKALNVDLSLFFRVNAPPEEKDADALIHAGFSGPTPWFMDQAGFREPEAEAALGILSFANENGEIFIQSRPPERVPMGTKERPCTQPFWVGAHPNDQTVVRTAFQCLVRGEAAALTVHYRVAHGDGTWHFMRTLLRRQVEPSTAPGILLCTWDLTDLRHEEEGASILVVDDDSALRECIVSMLERLGCPRVFEAGNGEEAVHSYRNNRSAIGLVLMDVNMPIMDGIRAFGILRQMNPRLKVVFSTGAIDAFTGKGRDLQDKATAILHKPFGMADLEAVLQVHLP